MPLYTFYPCRLDDTSLGFETYDLVDDEEAALRTLKVLDDHASAQFVVAWCGDRKVFIRYRAKPARAAALVRRSGEATAP